MDCLLAVCWEVVCDGDCSSNRRVGFIHLEIQKRPKSTKLLVVKMSSTRTEAEEIAYWKEEMQRLADKQDEDKRRRIAEKEKEESMERQMRKEGTKHRRLYVLEGAISIYKSVTRYLVERGGWTTSDTKRGIDLLFVAHCDRKKKKGLAAGGINFSLLNAKDGSKDGRVLVNCYRGFESICDKVSQALSLKGYCEHHEKLTFTDMCPETFVFRRVKKCDQSSNENVAASELGIDGKRKLANGNELKNLHVSFEASKESSKNCWIIKPDEGHCGEGIEIRSSWSEIVADVERMTPTTSLVVQKYIERPLTVQGGRKFDIRCWVCLTSDYRVGLYREGVYVFSFFASLRLVRARKHRHRARVLEQTSYDCRAVR